MYWKFFAFLYLFTLFIICQSESAFACRPSPVHILPRPACPILPPLQVEQSSAQRCPPPFRSWRTMACVDPTVVSQRIPDEGHSAGSCASTWHLRTAMAHRAPIESSYCTSLSDPFKLSCRTKICIFRSYLAESTRSHSEFGS